MIPNEEHCPEHIRASLNEYVLRGRPLGGFLTAVMENDLVGAIALADGVNLNLLPHIAAWVVKNVPTNVYGSPQAVAAHLRAKEKERAALWRSVPIPP